MACVDLAFLRAPRSMTPSERKALLFLAAVTVAGMAVRLAGGAEGGTRMSETAGDRMALDAQLAAVDSAMAHANGDRPARRRSQGATAREGAPRVSRGLDVSATPSRTPRGSRAYVASRDAEGAVRDDAADARTRTVRGSTARVRRVTRSRDAARDRTTRRSSADEDLADRAPIDVDVADAAALDALPGIGPALAQRIVEDRARDGGFGSLAALQRVRGVGPKLAQRVAPYVTFSASPRPTRAGAGWRAPP